MVVFLVWKGCSDSSGSKKSLEIVRAAKITRGDLEIKITATGEIKPQNRVEIKPTISGRIDEVLVEEGEEVKQGQILAWMSSTERAALLDAARAQGPEAFEKWQNAYKPAPLIAPLDGMVIVRAVEPGQTVSTTDPVVVLSDRLIVNAQVDETDLSLIKIGQRAEIGLDAYPDRFIEAKVDHISYESTLVNNVNVYAVDVLPDQIPSVFRSGMTANVVFLVAERKGTLLVPSEAVSAFPKHVKNPNGYDFAIYKKSFGGKLVPMPVRIGESDGRVTEILEGIKENEEIVIVKSKRSELGTNPFSARRPNRQSRPSN
ncbi:MAG: efflux RND transporter periplasmic adaptor subunit [Candidatus Omnitrophica bacterium]|nr:efflux RND transporter periplasmic adaptor subunit [Candidatus Omnitrophota bacterium]